MKANKNKFSEDVKQFWSNVKNIKIDKQNYVLFIEDMRIQQQDQNSKYNRLGLTLDEETGNISCMINLPENYQLSNNEALKYNKLREQAVPVSKYIRELDWGEYFSAPAFYHIEDDPADLDTNANEVSCTYIAVWTYTPILNNYPNFWKQFATMIGINTTLAAGIATGLTLLLI